MNSAMRSARPGRVGYPVNYRDKDHVMPPPPRHAKEVHDQVDVESTADPLGIRLPIKWNAGTGMKKLPKFGREVSHMKLDNICTMECRVNDPKTRALQCWYLPKLPRRVRPIVVKAGDAPKMFRIFRPSRFFARPEMWGAWNISTEAPSSRERERTTRRSIKCHQNNSERFYRSHSDAIRALRRMHKRGAEKPEKESEIQIFIDHLKKRKEDVEAVLNLDALRHSLELNDE